MKNWHTKQTEIVHRNPWYRVRRDDVVRPDGTDGEYFVVETHGASVFTVLVNDTNEILLVGQERYTSGIYSWEVPGGNSDGQDALVAAQRELLEETGYSAAEWTPIGISYPMNGVSNEKSHIFIATDLSLASQNKQAEEGITAMQWVDWPRAWDMIKTGEITDNQTITALTKAALKLKLIYFFCCNSTSLVDVVWPVIIRT